MRLWEEEMSGDNLQDGAKWDSDGAVDNAQIIAEIHKAQIVLL